MSKVGLSQKDNKIEWVSAYFGKIVIENEMFVLLYFYKTKINNENRVSSFNDVKANKKFNNNVLKLYNNYSCKKSVKSFLSLKAN